MDQHVMLSTYLCVCVYSMFECVDASLYNNILYFTIKMLTPQPNNYNVTATEIFSHPNEKG